MRSKPKPEARAHRSIHATTPIFLNDPVDLNDWTDVRPVAGTYRLKNVLHTDGRNVFGKVFYLVAPKKKPTTRKKRS
jgi:hypothetical protein